MKRIKAFLAGALGAFGTVVYVFLCLFAVALPLAMIEMPFWLSLIASGVVMIFPILVHVFILWGFVSALTGPQDVLAVIYYVFFACFSLIAYIPDLIRLLSFLFRFVVDWISEHRIAWKVIKFFIFFLAWVLVAFWATDGFSKFPALFERKNESQEGSHAVESSQVLKTEIETESETDKVYEIILNAELIYNEGIGNNWDVVFRFQGEEIQSGKRITLRETPYVTYNYKTKAYDNRPYQNVYVSVHITEKDDTPEYNTMFLNIPVDEPGYPSGVVVITENGGPNKGKQAEWSVSGLLRLVS